MFEDFLKEQQFINNVSPRTLEHYKLALRWLDDDPKKVVIKMRESGLTPRSINSYRTALNHYWHWASGAEDKCHPGCKHPRIAKMKCEEKVLPTFTPDDISKLNRWKPKTYYEKRLHLLLLTLADTGIRISEALGVKWSDVDLENGLITVMGKGRKSRTIPFSFELRRHLFKWKKEADKRLVFSTRDGGNLMRRNMLRDEKRLLGKLGIVVPERSLHALRHTYAINALRRGASPFHIQRQLGHTDLTMTKRYCNLNTADLAAVHQQCSLLA